MMCPKAWLSRVLYSMFCLRRPAVRSMTLSMLPGLLRAEYVQTVLQLGLGC
jgi:hypothetical protein